MRVSETKVTRMVAMVAASIGITAAAAHAATPHPLTLGLRSIDLACDVQAQTEPSPVFGSVYCSEMARVLAARLGVPVKRVDEAGPVLPDSLPRAGIIWIQAALTLTQDTATARAAWGSYAPQRGVPASEEGAPLSLPLDGSAPETVATTLAGMVVDQMSFVPGS